MRKENVLAKFHQWFDVPYRLHSTVVGEGPTIVMLHGIATTSASWDKLVPYLENNYKCATLDLIGFGQSPKPDWYSYSPDDHIRSINYTVKKLKIKEPFILVGHSMGSLLALHYAANHPEKVKQLYMLSPPVYLTKKDAQKARKIWRDMIYARAYKYIRTHKNFTLKGARGLKRLVLKNNPFSITDDTWLAFSKSLEECIEKQDVVYDLKQIASPVEVFYGTLDQLLIKNNIHKFLSDPKVRMTTLRNGHLISDKYARLVAEHIMETGL
jgi:pimeloyl-ACP methyl ester carboxylesterase